MITQNRLSFGVLTAEWQDRVNTERMRRERAARARAELNKAGFPVILLSEAENRRYTTGIDSGTRGPVHNSVGMTIFFTEKPDDTVVWEAAGDQQRQTLHSVSWIKPENVRIWHSIIPNMVPAAVEAFTKINAEEVYQTLKAAGVAEEKIAYDAIDARLKQLLEEKGLKLFGRRDLMMEARSIKTADEIACMKLAGAVATHGLMALYDNLKPGITEAELAAKIAEVVIRYQNRGIQVPTIRSGPNTAPNNSSRSPTDRIIEPGDMVFVDMAGIMFNGYRSCYYRTFKCGLKPTQEEKDTYKRVFEWLLKAEETVKPGVSTAEIAKCFPPATHFGFKEGEYTSILTCLGHGVGLGQFEKPFIQRAHSLDYPETVEKGMVFALETWDGVEFKYGVRVENLGLVTDTGFEKFYSWPDEEIIVPEHSLLIH
ncbi:MAG: aminopeptidase P family protein [Chloroflexi bacterium]|nr:aminopeptidase P family protein [Chloroflexota bacterium]